MDRFWQEHLAASFVKTSNKGRKPKKPTKEMFRVLFLDLYVAWLEDPDLALGVSRTPEDYVVNDRYNALFISDKIIDVTSEVIFSSNPMAVRDLLQPTGYAYPSAISLG